MSIIQAMANASEVLPTEKFYAAGLRMLAEAIESGAISVSAVNWEEKPGEGGSLLIEFSEPVQA